MMVKGHITEDDTDDLREQFAVDEDFWLGFVEMAEKVEATTD